MTDSVARSQHYNVSHMTDGNATEFSIVRSDEVDMERAGSWNALQAVSVIKYLAHDRRPILVLDLQSESGALTEPLRSVYINPALFSNNVLYDHVEGRRSNDRQLDKLSYQSFLVWARSVNAEFDSSYTQFGGAGWESLTLDNRWNVLIANLSTVISPSTLDQSTASLSTDLYVLPDDHAPTLTSQVTSKYQENQSRSTDLQDTHVQNSVASSDAIAFNLGPSSPAPSRNVVPLQVALEPFTADPISDAHAAISNADLLAKIANLGIVGIVVINAKGEILFANDRWYELTQHPREMKNAMAWMNTYEEDELPRIMGIWRRVAIDLEPVQYQTRLKRRWKPSAPYESAPTDLPTWITAWAYPDLAADRTMVGACGVWTEISELKWGERLAEQKLADAEEKARLLEELSLRAKEAADSEARFRRLFDMMPCGVWVSDPLGNMLYANDVYNELFPGARDAGAPEPWWQMIPEEEVPRVKGFYRQVLDEHAKLSFEFRIKKNSSAAKTQYRWALASVYPEVRDDGQLKHITGCVTDISHWKVAEELQTTRASDALESKRQLERFIDMTSHEIRNPLSAIMHSAEEIISSFREQFPKDTVLSEAIQNAIDAAETIILCTEHSTRIVDDILLVSKLESGLLNISPTVVQPITGIKQALKMFDGEMKAADITQSLTVDETSFDQLQVDWVYLDVTRVRQVFINLITNAIKFTRPEETRQIKTHVKVSLERPSNNSDDETHYLAPLTERSVTDMDSEIDKERTIYLIISVEDSGCGLSEAEQKNLFQRFQQAGKRTHVKYGGTGLGLFISRQLCEMQGGQIGLKSTTQQGSMFSFYVMVQKAAGPETMSRTSTNESGHRTSSSPETIVPSVPSTPPKRSLSKEVDTATESRCTILLVEDNVINQKVVAKKLVTQGYEVVVANHGLEALSKIKESTLWSQALPNASCISLILLDLEMPVMDGLTCIRAIREMERLKEVRCHVPVIAVTANARQDQINQAMEAGMDDVITKPFRTNQIFPMMTQLMNRFPVSGSLRP